MAEKINVVLLGSGSAVPTAEKNHPGILLDYKAESMLFDCGEGIQRQFRKARINPCRITRLFITHWHGDHVLGIPGLLQTLALNDYSKTLKIYGPKGTKEYLSKMMETFARTWRVSIDISEVSAGNIIETEDFIVGAENAKHNISCLAYNFAEKDKLRIDKKKLAKIKISNSPVLGKLKQGKDIIINGKKINYKSVTYLQNGRKVSIVLDTLFDDKIVKFARNSDLLICEATYLDEAELAKAYYHLTVSDAVRIAKLSKSKKLVLIHMSQRHSLNEKKFLDLAKKAFKNTEIGRDLMRFEI